VIAATTRRACAVTVSLLFVFGPLACAHVVPEPNQQGAAVARSLGLSGCVVSVALSQEEALGRVRASGNPHPEELESWTSLVAIARPADQLRLVNCLGVRTGSHPGQYFYGLFRNGNIVAKVQPMIFN